MSYHEAIRVYHPVDVAAYLAVLKRDYAASAHPRQPQAWLIGDPPLPFYEPQLLDDTMSILSFNYVPLSSLLLQALRHHPELAPPAAYVRWSAEQDLLIQGGLATVVAQLSLR